MAGALLCILSRIKITSMMSTYKHTHTIMINVNKRSKNIFTFSSVIGKKLKKAKQNFF